MQRNGGGGGQDRETLLEFPEPVLIIFPSISPEEKVSFRFILMYLLAEQSSLVCKCELSDRCDKKFH